MDDVKQRLIHLDHCRGAGWKTIYQLLTIDPTLKILNECSNTEISHLLHISSSTVRNLLLDFHSETIQRQIQTYAKNNIKIIAIFDEQYPVLLKEIYQPPWLLYVKGDTTLLTHPTKLAVVGSRQITEYGKAAIRQLLPEIINKQAVIVSGLAKGVDTISHETTIQNGGKTIAIIAGGLYNIYPKENKLLATQLMKNQLVVSEYPPFTLPTKWQFPMRNRIISGMSCGTLVIEAKKRSGSFITADHALHEGREVFALPGNINHPYSEGTNRLIQKGAKLVITAEDVFEELPTYF